MGMRLGTWRKESKLELRGKSGDGKKVHNYYIYRKIAN